MDQEVIDILLELIACLCPLQFRCHVDLRLHTLQIPAISGRKGLPFLCIFPLEIEWIDPTAIPPLFLNDRVSTTFQVTLLNIWNGRVDNFRCVDVAIS